MEIDWDEIEPGFWYRNNDEPNQHYTKDPETNGKWIVVSDRDEDDSSLNDLINYHLSAGTMKRPEDGKFHLLRRQ